VYLCEILDLLLALLDAYPQPGRPRLECLLDLLDSLKAMDKHESPVLLVGREVLR
jgi:hypothetical protein